MAIEFKDVARLLTCRQFAEAEGMRIQGGRAVCPFHGGKHYNLKFLPDGHVYCHVCHKAGDVVALAAATWHTSQRDAAEELNQRFKLGLEGERLTKAECDKRELERQRERDQRDNAKRAEAEEWARACDAEREARLAMLRFSEADADKREFSLALARLCEAQQRCDVIQAARGAGTV